MSLGKLLKYVNGSSPSTNADLVLHLEVDFLQHIIFHDFYRKCVFFEKLPCILIFRCFNYIWDKEKNVRSNKKHRGKSSLLDFEHSFYLATPTSMCCTIYSYVIFF